METSYINSFSKYPYNEILCQIKDIVKLDIGILITARNSIYFSSTLNQELAVFLSAVNKVLLKCTHVNSCVHCL